MKFYDCSTAPSPRRVRIFLAEKGITVPTVQVDLRGGEQFSPAFRAINADHGAGAGVRRRHNELPTRSAFALRLLIRSRR